ncbi:MAG TPA: YHS domain-containing protein [Chitinophagaceae bacterium]|jgi:YHS domain-containing protein|nr:YHS domain-containing protein [Chitinophagaceae bacterium]HNU14190.1 YHS domain-containing protein [Chitinophagaceae bacterium]
MKSSVFYMTLPVALIAAIMMFNQSSSKTCQDRSHCQKIRADIIAAPDTLRPDPICNMKVDDKKGDTIHYKGHIFGFCSRYCRAEFMKNPDSYLPKKKN